MENLVIDSAFWRGRRVLVTGHTGFKGAWLSLALARLNARATGFALAPPTDPSLFELAGVDAFIADRRGDIRDLESFRRAMSEAEPEIVFHLAAQPLVRRSYLEPVGTYAANVMGVVHVLEAARLTPGVRVVIVVTSDKCYDNREWLWGYREPDRLGGRDPYSNSKACAELVAAAYRDSFCSEGPVVATARAGNVIGGGDFAEDRIVPDAVRALARGETLALRNPRAVRPWQHVLEPLAGYLLLAQQAFRDGAVCAEAWNFGPGADSERDVETLLARFMAEWGAPPRWAPDRAPQPHEAGLLRLDASKAREKLGWRPLLDFSETAAWTAQWHRAHAQGADMRAFTLDQLDAYLGRIVRLTAPISKEEDRHAARRIA